MKLVQLIAPPGCDECNYGTQRYRVHEDGTVMVPEEALAGLVGVGGFAPVDQPEPALSGEIIAMRGPDGAGCSWGGVSYPVDDAGLVHVPLEAVRDLESFGFRFASE